MATLVVPGDFEVESQSETTVNIAWVNTSTGHTGTKIERALGDGGFSQIANVGPTAYTYHDTGLAVGTRYRYRIRATDD